MTGADRALLSSAPALVVRVVVTAALLGWVLARSDLELLGRSVRQVALLPMIALWSFTLLSYWTSSLSLRLILVRLGCPTSTGTIFSASAVTGLYSLAVPGALSTGMKWFLLRRAVGDGGAVLAAMLYNQVQVLVAVLLVGSVAVTATQAPASLRATWVAVAVTLLVALPVARSVAGRLLAGRGVAIVPGGVEAARRAGTHLEHLRTAGAPFHLSIGLLTVGNLLLGGVAPYLLAACAVGVRVRLPVLALVWAAVYLLGRLPISIANLGVREVTVVGLLGLWGVDSATALLLSLLVFTSAVLIALIGAGSHLRGWQGLQR